MGWQYGLSFTLVTNISSMLILFWKIENINVLIGNVHGLSDNGNVSVYDVTKNDWPKQMYQ